MHSLIFCQVNISCLHRLQTIAKHSQMYSRTKLYFFSLSIFIGPNWMLLSAALFPLAVGFGRFGSVACYIVCAPHSELKSRLCVRWECSRVRLYPIAIRVCVSECCGHRPQSSTHTQTQQGGDDHGVYVCVCVCECWYLMMVDLLCVRLRACSRVYMCMR